MLLFVHDYRLKADVKSYKLLLDIRAALERAAAAREAAAAAARRANAEAAAAEAEAAECYPWLFGDATETPQEVGNHHGAESDESGDEGDGGMEVDDGVSVGTGQASLMEEYIRAHVDREMAFELLRKLTGSRGKSCKIAVLHQKVIDAWADRLSLLNESDVTALREQHTPGAELDRRFQLELARAALRSAEAGMSEEELIGW